MAQSIPVCAAVLSFLVFEGKAASTDAGQGLSRFLRPYKDGGSILEEPSPATWKLFAARRDPLLHEGAGRSQPLATAKRSAAETEESHPRLGLYFRKDLQRVLQSGPDHVTQGDVRGVETHEQAGSRGEGLPGLEGGWAVNRRLRHLQRLALLGRSRRPRPAGFYFREDIPKTVHKLLGRPDN